MDNATFVYNTGRSTVSSSTTIFGKSDNSTHGQMSHSEHLVHVNTDHCILFSVLVNSGFGTLTRSTKVQIGLEIPAHVDLASIG